MSPAKERDGSEPWQGSPCCSRWAGSCAGPFCFCPVTKATIHLRSHRTVLVSSYCLSIIIHGASFSFQRVPFSIDKSHSHSTYDLSWSAAFRCSGRHTAVRLEDQNPRPASITGSTGLGDPLPPLRSLGFPACRSDIFSFTNLWRE